MLSTSPNTHRKWQVATTIAIGFAIIWNYLTNWFPPTGVTIAQLSDTVFANVKIIPANYTFAIWGLIYIGLVAFAFYQLDTRRVDNLPLQQTRPFIILASLLQCGWIILFLYKQMLLSSLVMLGIVWALIRCYRNFHSPQIPSRQLYPNWVPRVFSLYLGWISVATIVNIASTLDLYGWSGSPLSPTIWTIIAIAATVGLAKLLLWLYGDRVFGGVIIWAIGGVIIANLTNLAIALYGLIAIAILAIFVPLHRSISHQKNS